MTTTAPLAGRHILLTRPRDQSGELAGLLEALGATVLESPSINIVPAEDMRPLDKALRRVDDYAWIVVTSPNGARILIERVRAAGRQLARAAVSPGSPGARPPMLSAKRPRLAAIGPGTAGVLEKAGLPVDLVPSRVFQAEGLLEALGPLLSPGEKVLLVRAAEARPVLPDGLRSLGAEVDVVVAYSAVPGGIDRDRVVAWLREGLVDAITFTSGSTVRYFVDTVGTKALLSPPRPRIVCLGPVTADTARRAALPVDKTAVRATMADLVAAVVDAVKQSGDRLSPDK